MKLQLALEEPGPSYLITAQCVTFIVTHEKQFLTLVPLALLGRSGL